MGLYFFDTEFIENGRTIDLISIGIVCEDGRELYLQNNECNFFKADGWVKENVLSKLDGFIPNQEFNHIKFEGKYWFEKLEIAQKIKEFIIGDRKDNQLWAYYGAYDHVALCQLFGKMIDLPDSIPMFTNDLMQLQNSLGIKELPKQEGNLHNALSDAVWTKQAYEFLQQAKK